MDYFKAFNDSLGHLAGDHALRLVAATIQKFAPADAIVARYGGEEFACLLYDLDLPAAHAIAERIRTEVARRTVEATGRASRQITINAGVACRLLNSEETRRKHCCAKPMTPSTRPSARAVLRARGPSSILTAGRVSAGPQSTSFFR